MTSARQGVRGRGAATGSEHDASVNPLRESLPNEDAWTLTNPDSIPMWHGFWDEIRRIEADAALGAPTRELPGRIAVELPPMKGGGETVLTFLGPAPPGHVPCAEAAEVAGEGRRRSTKRLTTHDMDIRDFYMANAAKGQEAMRRKKAEGERMHLAPLGWRNARDELGRSVLEPDLEKHEILRALAGMRERGLSVRDLCREGRRLGLKSKRGNRVGPSAMHRALRSFGVGTEVAAPDLGRGGLEGPSRASSGPGSG